MNISCKVLRRTDRFFFTGNVNFKIVIASAAASNYTYCVVLFVIKLNVLERESRVQ